MPDASAGAHSALRAAAPRVLAWAMALGIGVYLRLNGLLASVVGDEIAANGPDSAYHARRMLQTWAHYPRVPVFDPLLDWPHGAVAPWPPGFDFIVASFALPASDRFGALLLISLAPVVLGMTLVVLVGWATRSLAPKAGLWTAWLAASLVAIFPQAVSVARFGNPDHHIAEALIMLGLGLWSLAGWRALAGGELARERRVAFEAAGAVLIGASIASFIGTPMYVWIAAANLGAANLLWGRGARTRWAVGAPALVLGAGAGALSYHASLAAHGQLFSYVYPSLLQPLLVGAAALACIAASALGWAFMRGARARTLCLAFVPAVIAVALLIPSGRAAFDELLHGLYEWFADSSSPLAALTENQPLFTPYTQGAPFWSRAHRYYGVFGVLLPLLIPAGLFVHLRRQGWRDALPFVFWTACITCLMLLQNRFGRVGLVNLAFCTALLFDATLAKHAVARHALWIVPLLALAFDPPFAFYRAAQDADAPLPGIQEAGVFLRDHTPAPHAGARSGVIVPWDEAHFIVRYGERPVTATGFGVYVAPDAIDEVHRIWSDDEQRLLRFASRRDLGFVALSANDFNTIRFHGRGPLLPPAGTRPSWNVEYFQRLPLAALLLCGSGSADAGLVHMAHLLPRFASTSQAADLPAFTPDSWVYEIVAGAVVRGRVQPNATVRLRTPLRLRDQPFVHEAWAKAGPDGKFELTTPLPTGYHGVHLATGPSATLSAGARDRTKLVIPERAVRSGTAQDWTAQSVVAVAAPSM